MKAERRWRGVGPREHSCDHLQHDRVLHRRAALRRRGAGKVKSGPAKVVRLKFGSSSHELLDCLHIVASHGVVQARDLRAGPLGAAFAFRAERHRLHAWPRTQVYSKGTPSLRGGENQRTYLPEQEKYGTKYLPLLQYIPSTGHACSSGRVSQSSEAPQLRPDGRVAAHPLLGSRARLAHTQALTLLQLLRVLLERVAEGPEGLALRVELDLDLLGNAGWRPGRTVGATAYRAFG